jgi:hypothetical protein
LKKVALLFVLIFLAACAQGSEMLLKAKDVQFFKVNEFRSSSSSVTKLEISGLAFHSSLAVREITKNEAGDELTIFVSLTPAKPGLSGNFAYEVTLPANINVVYFGEDKTVIWKRK